MGVNSLPMTVTRQRRGCDFNPGPSAPEKNHSAIEPPLPLLPSLVVAYRALYVHFRLQTEHRDRKCADTIDTVLVPCMGRPFPMLKYKYIFQIKYTEAILSNSTRKLLRFAN